MQQVPVRPSSSVERALAILTVLGCGTVQGLAATGVVSWWVAAVAAVAAFAAWIAVHVNGLDRPRVGNGSTALAVAFLAVSVVLAIGWRSATVGLVPAVIAGVVSVVPLAIYFGFRR
ncbi:hypothetical protein [Williamsia sp. CHRR-6]|uniref:hypothetical protein n=1 Tax=Williamsia sp. CHRR-6 TaxID=2835871 RepID=UPI001BDAB665|nr:hypothetical protein [Williamsia sp. CHRR-6]MBT0565890.1 hypothetical protein [Williamsia sp. CHRR-6]